MKENAGGESRSFLTKHCAKNCVKSRKIALKNCAKNCAPAWGPKVTGTKVGGRGVDIGQKGYIYARYTLLIPKIFWLSTFSKKKNFRKI